MILRKSILMQNYYYVMFFLILDYLLRMNYDYYINIIITLI